MLRTGLEICQENKLKGLLFFVVSSVGSMWGCSDCWKKRFTTTGYADTPNQSANSILEDWVTLITISGGRLLYVVNSEPHTGTYLGPFVRGANKYGRLNAARDLHSAV
jgi:hypothetical protein